MFLAPLEMTDNFIILELHLLSAFRKTVTLLAARNILLTIVDLDFGDKLHVLKYMFKI